MVMLTPDGERLNSDPRTADPAGSDWLEYVANIGGALSAFDTLRALARRGEATATGRLLATARHAVCIGKASGIIWIVAAQQLEHEGEIPRAAGAFLAAAFTEDMAIAAWETDPEISAIGRRLEAIERANGLRPGEYWRIGEGPPEWQTAEREWSEAFDRRWQALLRRFGEHELAELLESDREEFERRVDAGQRALLG